MFRRRRAEVPTAPDLGDLAPAWRARVEDMVGSRDRFASLVAQAPPGALRDRLAGSLVEVEAAVDLSVGVAVRAQAAAALAETLDVGAATAALKEARRRLDQLRDHPRADVAGLEAEVARRAAHHAAVHRALNAVDDADARVDILSTRLRTAVAEAAAIVVRSSSGDELDRLDGELRDVHGSLAAVGRALVELEA